jgi:hypothetical protein
VKGIVSENNANIIQVRKMRWAELVARTGRRKIRGLEKKQEERGPPVRQA